MTISKQVTITNSAFVCYYKMGLIYVSCYLKYILTDFLPSDCKIPNQVNLFEFGTVKFSQVFLVYCCRFRSRKLAGDLNLAMKLTSFFKMG